MCSSDPGRFDQLVGLVVPVGSWLGMRETGLDDGAKTWGEAARRLNYRENF